MQHKYGYIEWKGKEEKLTEKQKRLGNAKQRWEGGTIYTTQEWKKA